MGTQIRNLAKLLNPNFDKIVHFKREMVPEEELIKNPGLYIYKFMGIAIDTATNKEVVIYQAMYSKDKVSVGQLFTRPIEEFNSEVDHEKYPNVKQKYRFEKL